MKSSTREAYEKRLARAAAAIENNPGAPHRLEDLAALANFSPFHFHRIYVAMRGETVFETIRRARLRRAAHELASTRRRILDIALEVGFDSAQSFARAFRAHVTVSPSAFRRSWRTFVDHAPERAVSREERPMDVKVVEQEPLRVHVMRYEGPVQEIGAVWRQVWSWLVERDLVRRVSCAVGFSYGGPDAQGRIVYYAGVALDGPAPAADGVEIVNLPGGSYGCYRLIGPYSGIGAAFPRLFGEWLPNSGYDVDHRPALELYRNNPYDTPAEELITDLLIPVK